MHAPVDLSMPVQKADHREMAKLNNHWHAAEAGLNDDDEKAQAA
jgi:hypothetical protein